MHFSCAARTDVGIVRSGNEDNYLMLADRGVFIVADGMGGHAAGEVASEMAVRITSHEIGSLRGLSDAEASDRMRTAIRTANDAIFERTLSEHDKRGMGTTATVLVLMPRRYLIGQVGDSRAYLLRNGQLLQLTKDHSYVQEQVDAGLLTPDQARVHPYSNVITRCVGASGDVVPDIYFGALEQGDILLIASDGLTGMLEDEHLIRILNSEGGPQHWVDRMITEANRRGGLDNITAIVIRIESVDSNTGEQPVAHGRGGQGQLALERDLHLDVGAGIAVGGVERNVAETVLAVEGQGGAQAGIRDQDQPAGMAAARKRDHRLHQPVTVAPAARVRGYGHLGQLERLGVVPDDGAGALHALGIEQEEDLPSRPDDLALGILEDLPIFRFHLEVPLDPLAVQPLEIGTILRPPGDQRGTSGVRAARHGCVRGATASGPGSAGSRRGGWSRRR